MKNLLKKLFTIKFTGRMRRAEFWLGQIILVPLNFALLCPGMALMNEGGSFAVVTGYMLMFLLTLPISLIIWGRTARRLHDIGFSGWVQLSWIIPLIAKNLIPSVLSDMFYIVGATFGLVLLLLNSQSGENKYGANPKGK